MLNRTENSRPCPAVAKSAWPLAKHIKAAFVFGSVAKRSDTVASDIDLLVISERVDYADIFEAVQPAEAKLGRTINPTVYTVANWRKKTRDDNAFVTNITKHPKIFLIGREEDLG
jgi:predicted nucleotidyltransferase